MGCFAENIIKYILFGVNLVFTLGGLVLLVIGIIVQVHVVDVSIPNGYLAPVISIVAGGIIFIIAFFGCWGAIKENRCFLTTYSILMIVLMIINIIMGIVIFVDKDGMLEDLIEILTDTFENNRNHFLQIQSSFKCCGTTGPEVYLAGAVPASCCPAAPCNVYNSFAGCNTVVYDFFDTFWVVIGAFVFVIASVGLVGAIFAFSLSRHIGNKQSIQVVDSS